MNNNSKPSNNGYAWSIQKGIHTIQNLSGNMTSFDLPETEAIDVLIKAMERSNTIVIGAGAGLSTAAGMTYSGTRFIDYFWDFAKIYNIQDMYSGGFYPFPTREIFWAWWSRHIYYNRYINAPKPVYKQLLSYIKNKNYFIITTNVDHQFQRFGFDKTRLFYTQGDYGLFQSTNPENKKTYDNLQIIEAMMEAQGFIKDEQGVYQVPEHGQIQMSVPAELIPICPDDGAPYVVNLRSDDTFVEDDGWHQAAKRYGQFIETYKDGNILFLELGVGFNTPVIIKYPFWGMTLDNPNAIYACINHQDAFCPQEIEDRAICINGNLEKIFNSLLQKPT
jgi:NAD-dependent SIR2 family protein deacetylase